MKFLQVHVCCQKILSGFLRICYKYINSAIIQNLPVEGIVLYIRKQSVNKKVGPSGSYILIRVRRGDGMCVT